LVGALSGIAGRRRLPSQHLRSIQIAQALASRISWNT
jgi:hypothetical protein